MREKKRPTLEQLKEMPVELLQLEVAQIGVDASLADQNQIESEAIILMDSPDITAEKVVALRDRLKGATGGTVAQNSKNDE